MTWCWDKDSDDDGEHCDNGGSCPGDTARVAFPERVRVHVVLSHGQKRALTGRCGLLTGRHCELTENQAVIYGGAIYNWGSVVRMSYCKLARNEAGDGGGAIYSESTTYIALQFAATLRLTDSELIDNHAAGAGAIKNDGGNLTLIRCTLKNNTASTGAYRSVLGGIDRAFCTLAGRGWHAFVV